MSANYNSSLDQGGVMFDVAARFRRPLLTIAAALAFPAVAQAQESRTAFVQLFEWKWTDVAKECETWLGPKGFAAVQISPAQEHPDVTSPPHPWWQRYQPVSYQLVSRSGSRAQLADMISRCNAVGVKVYADVVVNHMAGTGTPAGLGVGGSSFNPQTRQYPGVPYGPPDFHPQCNIDYGDAGSVRNCWIEGSLPDLRVETDYVRQKLIDHMNDLISLGVAGFRIDAGKHVRPEDLEAILGKVHNIGEAINPRTGQAFHAPVQRPYIFIEVIRGEKEPVQPVDYTYLGNVTEFYYGRQLAGKFRDPQQRLAQIRTFPGHPASADWGLLPSYQAVAFLDNHDNQRGHGNGAWQSDGRIANILTHHFDGNLYNLANVFMLAWPYGYPVVMSSYEWPINVQWSQDKFRDVNDWMGPPANPQGMTNDVTCFSGGWVCEHRWDNIAEMVEFRNYTGAVQDGWTVTNWWDNSADKIAFGRNGRGFVIINRAGPGITNQQFATGMPPGQYCEVLHADFNRINGTCSGTTVIVNAGGWATFTVPTGEAAAIYGGAKVGA
ncbi:MAG: alpha-amylase family protein [Rhodospirillales bacterium]|nr:alpha-amylase family protein [Rhodospirillales bacterium]